MWGSWRSELSFPGQCNLAHSLEGWECDSSVSKLQLVGRTRGRALPGGPQRTEAFEMKGERVGDPRMGFGTQGQAFSGTQEGIG